MMSNVNYTVKFPLEQGGAKTETFETLGEDEIVDVINFNIKSTILTHPGERRSDPDFGCAAKTFLFSYNSGQLQDFEQLESNIINGINEYVPYIIIDNTLVTTTEDSPNAIKIVIQYTIPNIKKHARFDLIISE